MKRHLLTGLAMLALLACNEDPLATDGLPVDPLTKASHHLDVPDTLYCSADAQTIGLHISCDVDWEITPGEGVTPDGPGYWGFIQMAPQAMQGTGDRNVAIAVSENTGARRIDSLLVTASASRYYDCRPVVIVQAGIPVYEVQVSPVYTFDNCPIVVAGDHIDFTVTGVDRIILRGPHANLRYSNADWPDLPNYISYDTVPNMPHTVRFTNLGIYGGLRFDVEFTRVSDGVKSNKSWFRLPTALHLSPTDPESAPAILLRGSGTLQEYTFSGGEFTGNRNQDIRMDFEHSDQFTMLPVPGTTDKVYLRNDGWEGGKLPVRFRCISNNQPTAVTWITSDAPEFVRVTAADPATASLWHPDPGYYRLPARTSTDLSLNVRVLPVVSGSVKVTLTPWDNSGSAVSRDYMFTQAGQQGVSYDGAAIRSSVFQISKSSATLSFRVPSLMNANLPRYGSVTFEYNGWRQTITLYQTD